MKKYYYVCNKCIDNQEIECYTIGWVGPRTCEVCRKEFEPKNISCVSLDSFLKIIRRYPKDYNHSWIKEFEDKMWEEVLRTANGNDSQI
jgi:hypothetical protein